MDKNIAPHFFLKLVLVFFLIFSSCANENDKKKDDNQSGKSAIYVSGQIVESITCRSNAAHSYANYLPTYFDPGKKYPVVIVFDAHARGVLAVSRFQKAAERYGYIIIGSNNAKNGLQDINPVVNSLWDDVLSRFPIDQKRIYTAGFSGGARIASSVAIYKGGIKGVIACAGGMPSVGQEISKKFDFLGIVGLNDFNYQEIKTLDNSLTKNGFVNKLLTFNGGHEWPSPPILSKALQWLDLMDMKEGQIAVNDNLVREYTRSYADTINQLIMAGENYRAYTLYNTFLKDLNGLYDVSDYQQSYQELLKNPQIKKGIEAAEIEKKNELDKQEIILNYFKAGEFAKLKAEIVKLKESAPQKHLSKRLLGFIGMLSYIYTENAVNSQNISAYNGFIDVYELAEPKNADKEFFKACQAMMDEKPEKALQYLQKAIEFGYYDVDKLQVIGYFEQLRNLPEFDLLIQKAIKNSKT